MQNQSSPESYCAEGVNSDGLVLQKAIQGENWETGVYDDAKGGLGLHPAGGGVKWRLPDVHHLSEAYSDGLNFIFPDFLTDPYPEQWASSIWYDDESGTGDLRYANTYVVASYDSNGHPSIHMRADSTRIRCMGQVRKRSLLDQSPTFVKKPGKITNP